MKWEKIAQRENDFLKNCLVYEAMKENFQKVFGINHPLFLTTRKGMTYTHYHNLESSKEMSDFVLNKIKKNPKFIKDLEIRSKNKFDNLISFCSNLSPHITKTNPELVLILKEYFNLYKEPYPYFQLTFEAREIQDQEVVNSLAKIRLYGRTCFNKTHQIILPLFVEIARRLSLPVKELKFLTPIELELLLQGKELQVNKLIQERQHCVFIHSKGQVIFHEDASLTFHYHEKEISEIKEIKGQGTFPGKYRGKVKLIKIKEDLEKVEQGEIIVLQMTTTDLITPHLQQAGAIITDEGGITCHAAILSREFKIPCIIGTEIATKILKDKDLVEVDAGKGVVKIIHS